MTTPTSTRAQVQARADALTNDYLHNMRLALNCQKKRLDAALYAVANGCPRHLLGDDEAAALRASPHKHIREPGARRLIAARLLSESNELIVNKCNELIANQRNELIVKQTNCNEKQAEEPVNWEKAFIFLAKMTCTGFVSSDEVSERVRVLRDFVDPRAADRVVEIFNKKRSKFLQEFMG